jgi:hypothetical protein
MSASDTCTPCWLCESEAERGRRDGRPGPPLLFAAAMPYARMMQSLCPPHRAGFEYMQSRASGRDIVPRAPHERRREG